MPHPPKTVRFNNKIYVSKLLANSAKKEYFVKDDIGINAYHCDKRG